MKISGAIFDMDGTILDSMYIWDDRVVKKFVQDSGVIIRDGFEQKFKDMRIADVPKYLEDEYNYSCTYEQVLEGLYSAAESFYRTEVVPKAGIIDILEDFQSRGIKMCVATATELHVAKMVLERLDMVKYFTEIFTCTMVGANKLSPTIYEAALEKLGTPKSETPVFEDALYAIRTAKAANFPIVGIYDAYFEHDQDEIMELSDIYIKDLRNGVGI